MSFVKRVVLCVACFAVLLMGLAACSSDPVEMPDVTGMTYAEAEEALDELNLKVSDKVAEDGSAAFVVAKDDWVVIAQDPASGTEVTRSSEITLTVKKKSEIEAEEQQALREQEQAEEAAFQKILDSLIGQSCKTAYDKLTAQGYTISWTHAQTKMDFTYEVDRDINNPDEYSISWVVVDVLKLDKDSKKITFSVNSQENLDSAAAASAVEQALTEKLNPSYALTAIKNYGEREYPYGFKLHSWVGVIAQTAEDENTWFFKVTCDVTNANGATAKNMVCEARVTGTTDSPQIIYFIVY